MDLLKEPLEGTLSRMKDPLNPKPLNPKDPVIDLRLLDLAESSLGVNEASPDEGSVGILSG